MGWMALRFFKVILLRGFQPTFTYISKNNVSTQHARSKRWSRCWSHNCLTTIQCWSPNKHFYLIIPTTIIEPHLNFWCHWLQLFSSRETLNLKKKNTWNKWQLEMAESLYVLDTTINLSFAICYLVLFDSVVGIKKIVSVFKPIYRMSI